MKEFSKKPWIMKDVYSAIGRIRQITGSDNNDVIASALVEPVHEFQTRSSKKQINNLDIILYCLDMRDLLIELRDMYLQNNEAITKINLLLDKIENQKHYL